MKVRYVIAALLVAVLAAIMIPTPILAGSPANHPQAQVVLPAVTSPTTAELTCGVDFVKKVAIDLCRAIFDRHDSTKFCISQVKICAKRR